MKKLIILLLTIISLFNLYSQDRTVFRKPFRSNICCDNRTYYKYIGTTKDTLSEYQDSISYEFYIAKSVLIGYAMFIDVENCNIKYQAKYFKNQQWFDVANIHPILDKGYRYLRMLVIYNGTGNVRMNYLEIKLYYDCVNCRSNFL